MLFNEDNPLRAQYIWSVAKSNLKHETFQENIYRSVNVLQYSMTMSECV